MPDFFRVCTKEPRKEGGPMEVFPDFTVGRSKDLMVRGNSFYAIWNEEMGLWSTDEYDVTAIVDRAVLKRAEELKAEGVPCTVKLLSSNGTNGWNKYKQYIKNAVDNSKQLDMKLTFANSDVKKSDYVSRRLPYSLALGDYSAWDELVGTLYNPEEREKIEWAIGAIVSGDSKRIEKFLVFYGPGGTGKSTIMKIIQMLFQGYVALFEAKALVGNNNTFATAAFKSNPLVAVQHDGDLSKIDDNSVLNSVVSHDPMTINEKYKSGYEMIISAFLFMGTNRPVKITDSKSGLIRRLIDVEPSLRTIEPTHFQALMGRIEFELGAIAHHCLGVYKKLGKNKYNDYRPTRMMLETDAFHNFVDEHFDIFRAQGGTTLQQAWELYKVWGEESKLGYSLKMYQFREKLKDYFDEFHDRTTIDGVITRKVYRGFSAQQFRSPIAETSPVKFSLVMDETSSIFDEMYAGVAAQYPGAADTPAKYWDKSERIHKRTHKPFIPEDDQVCSTVLGDLDTTKLHYVKVPEHHIVIDFDLKDDNGNKSLEVNEAAAASWPRTYAEVSKSGNGIHLHYIYDGDVDELASEYSPGIEVKVYRGNASLRRKLTKCNNVSVATISGGLPFREKTTTMLESKMLKSEKGLREMIHRNLRKEFHNNTKSSIAFIETILDDAYRSGLNYNVEDLKTKVTVFAIKSTNQQDYCVNAVARMRWKSEETSEEKVRPDREPTTEGRIVFFDCEVYPNLFVICWKFQGEGASVVRMINPSAMDVEKLLYQFKLVGFNNRSYDNHILYARYLGANEAELYRLSQRIMDNDDSAKYGEAWNLSYADVYDFSSDKKSLKKWEIELGIKHMEMDIPWDQPVPENRIMDVVDYCANDVIALEAVWDECKADFVARQTLADMSGLTVNQSTRQHVMRILFGNEKKPQGQFVYTDLSEMFPGYEFDEFSKTEKSKYREEIIGEGGYVHAEPGIHRNVAMLDVASMHPTSLIELNLFGPYTKKFQKIYEARLALKHDDPDAFAKNMPGVAWPQSKSETKALSDALKLVLNSTYGYTCAKFANPARDPRNKDNIVAKRGALFMVDLKHAVQEQGFTVVHIKTDSIKIANATPDIIAFVQEFGSKYGYTFEHEATYEKMCLVNDAVYIAASREPRNPDLRDGDAGYFDLKWTATGAEFKHPFVFKTLFSHQPITFRDLCETKQVRKGAMVLRFAEGDIRIGGKKDDALPEDELVASDPAYGIPDAPDHHIGRSGLFVPVNPDQDLVKGGHLICINGDKAGAVSGTKGYLWAEAESVRVLQDGAIERMVFEPVDEAVQGTGSIADIIDMSYYTQIAESAYQSIQEFGDAEEFIYS
jgi:predicted ABC-type ATPase